MSLILRLVSILSAIICCESANILYVIPYSVKSHYIMQRPVGLELARRGHNVTVITAHREKTHPATYHQVMVGNETLWDVLGGERPNLFIMAEYTAEDFHREALWKGGLALTEGSLKSPEVQSLLAENRSFDLVISEVFFQEATYALAHKYNAPLVLISTLVNCAKHNFITGNPLQLATASFEFLDANDPISFWGRFRNMYLTLYEYIWWRLWFLRKQEELVQKYIPNLPQPVPSLYELQKNASLLLLNGHYSFQSPVAFLPNIVEIGGLHLSEAHPNIKVFLSHGGLIGTLEAVFHGVPIIGVPVYGDQYKNLKKAEENGVGATLLYHDINEENLEGLLHEFLKDDTYLNRAKELSRRFKDRPMNALQTAMFWIEYVIRNKGAEYMKSPALKLNWITYNMIDVYTVIILVMVVILYVLCVILKMLYQFKLRYHINLRMDCENKKCL